MSLAAVDLQGDTKIIEVALKYGYSSPTAFNQAFRSVHGIAPSLVKGGGAAVKSYPPISFTISVKGTDELSYRIEHKEAFRIIGPSTPLSNEIEHIFSAVPQLWQEAAFSGTIPRIAALMASAPMGLLGVGACNDSEQRKYFIAVRQSD